MLIVKHRRNSIFELSETPSNFGIEVDIRSCGDHLIIHHDPFMDGENFETWLKVYSHDLLILNVKEEGLESRLISLMEEYGIDDYFFLDQSFPFLVKTAREGESRCALRISEYESINTALDFPFQIDWLWVDCFTKFPISKADADLLKSKGYKLCLVSPELQGGSIMDLHKMRDFLCSEKILMDAVCTKFEDEWK